MENQAKILDLLSKKQAKLIELEALVFGAVETRVKDGKKYLYLHKRLDGLQSTQYVGEYTDETRDLILNNNIKAKFLKKDLKNIDKELEALNYVDQNLPTMVAKNIDFARRHLADTIYKQAILEGVATTLSDTENILEGGKVNNMLPDDILKIINLKHAWDFILNKSVILSKTDFSILCMINKFVEEGFYYSAGKLRDVPVKIGGTAWQPPMPIEVDIKETIAKILKRNTSDVDKAITLLLYVTKSQMFLDGNKRTAVIFANHYLISQGKGLIVIPADKVDEYKALLIEYYESDVKSKNVADFIKQQCYVELL